MKKIYLLAFVLLYAAGMHAQAQFDFFTLYSSSLQTRSDQGWGFGSNLLSRPLELSPESKIFPVKMQLGGGFYFAGAGDRKLSGVTQDGTESEAYTVFSNSQSGVYGLARFSNPVENRQHMLYAEFFVGSKFTSSSMYTHFESDPEACTSKSFNKSIGFSGGAGTGMLIRLIPGMYLDLGMQWTGSTNNGKFVDMSTVRNSGDGLMFDIKNVPAGTVMFKAGLSFRIGGCCSYTGCKKPGHHTSKSCKHSVEQ
ncbi:MAG: hypothetical protein M3R17_12935 [Bacteroidota bacterium]|nr:hypothetical protein [Bacteroidota bacterium]